MSSCLRPYIGEEAVPCHKTHVAPSCTNLSSFHAPPFFFVFSEGSDIP